MLRERRIGIVWSCSSVWMRLVTVLLQESTPVGDRVET